MDPIFDWVDKNGPDSAPTFSARRTGKLLVALLASAILAGLPVGLLQLGLSRFKQAREERRHQQELQKTWMDTEQAAREGQTGEAFKRLFGIQAPREGQTEAVQ